MEAYSLYTTYYNLGHNFRNYLGQLLYVNLYAVKDILKVSLGYVVDV